MTGGVWAVSQGPADGQSAPCGGIIGQTEADRPAFGSCFWKRDVMTACPKKLLFVDDDPNILDILERMITPHAADWDAHFCLGAEEAMDLVEQADFDTIVSDARMPEKDGFWLLKRLQESERTRGIPVIILTGDCEPSLKRQALEMGATDLLNKPICREDLLGRLRSALRLKGSQDALASHIRSLEDNVRERTRALETSHREIVWRLAKACEYRDDETGQHVMRVAFYSRAIAAGLGMAPAFVDEIFLTSPLHDIGKIAMPDRVFLKPGLLTPAEMKVMQSHCEIGARLLLEQPQALNVFHGDGSGTAMPFGMGDDNPFIKMASRIALGHHEKWDGTGYPNSLAGEDIPIESRIVALADVFDALVTERPYKPAFSLKRSLDILAEETGRHFDPEVCRAFHGRIGEIEDIRTRFLEKPSSICIENAR